MEKQLFRVADLIAFLLLGLALLIYPDLVNDTLSRIIGAYFIIRSLGPAIKIYKQYRGKKVVDEFLKQD